MPAGRVAWETCDQAAGAAGVSALTASSSVARSGAARPSWTIASVVAIGEVGSSTNASESWSRASQEEAVQRSAVDEVHPIQVDDERWELGKFLELLGELARDGEVELADDRHDRDVGLLGVDPLYVECRHVRRSICRGPGRRPFGECVIRGTHMAWTVNSPA